MENIDKNGYFKQLKTKLKEKDAECIIVSASHIPELESEINLLYKDSLIDEGLYEKYIQDYFDFSITNKYPLVRSLIIIATPSPQIDVKFNINESFFWSKIPPAYSDRKNVTGNIKNITSQIFDSNGYKTIPVILPKKLLAVHSGLARFGKNNLSYVSGMGSYHRLTVFASDLACMYDSWQNLQILDKCSSCNACHNNCPSSAISNDQFVIKAERCLTYFNEQLDPFPKWIDTKWHNSIVGCMRCQSICPENKKYISAIENKEEFSKTETSLILKGIPFKELPERLQLKIKNLSLEFYYKQLSRNLAVLIDNKSN
jgi:epoxyqueuosine reductase